MEVLKLGIENPYLRDPQITQNYKKSKDEIHNPLNIHYKQNDDEREKAMRYEQYAFMVWNICETVYDRKKVDKTWYPIIKTERKLHSKWLQEPENTCKFKPEFTKFIDNFDNFKPKLMTVRAARPYLIFGILLVFFIFGLPILYSTFTAGQGKV
jgi:hypothetical protein